MARAKKAADAPQVEIAPRAPDEVLQTLVAAGIATSEYLLDLNGFLTTPYDMKLEGVWALPSGLFSWPIAVTRFDGVTQRRMSLMHPEVKAHPFVQQIEALFNVSLEYDPANAKIGPGRHAGDLMTAERWRDLIETRRFTTDDAMVGALAFAVSYGSSGIGPRLAKEILAAIGVSLPANGIELLCGFMAPSSLTDEDKAVRWPVNTGVMAPLDRLAAFIAGLELGWIVLDRGGHAQWTPLGIERYAAGADALVVESADGQFSFGF